MSEKIKITVVIDNENTNAHQQRKSLDSVDVTHDPSMTIMSTLLQNDLISGSFCGGRGDCGRCRIRIIEGVMEPTDLEKTVLTPEELKRGYRLACAARPKNDCVIRIAAADTPDIAIVTDMIGVTENIDHISQQKNKTINRRSCVTEPASDEAINDTNRDGARAQPETIRETMIAVDLGTTTIAMQLMETDTGRVIDTYCEMNPQRSYGADVLSRIQASCEGNREKLQDLVTEALERGVTRFRQRKTGAPDAEAWGKRGAQAADLQDDGAQSSEGQASGRIVCMCIAGNTAMEHLLMGYDVSTLGRSPFVPVETGLQEYRHPGWDFPVWLVPVISAFVGGDIVAGLYACGMLPAGPARSGRAADLLIDLGTNGEMVISDGTRMIATATAAGPAFEGGAGAGMIGSDMIACTAELLRRGVLDETGLLAEPYFTEGVDAGRPSVHLKNGDIRGLQMAKAAVRAGIEILWKKMGDPAIGRVYLAGGFGCYLDVEAAFAIGMFPAYMRGHVQAVGNTSLAGAYRIGRALYRRQTADGRIFGRQPAGKEGLDRASLERELAAVETVNLAEQEGFESLYIGNLNFPAENQ